MSQESTRIFRQGPGNRGRNWKVCSALGIKEGWSLPREPAKAMAALARERRIKVYEAYAEKLLTSH